MFIYNKIQKHITYFAEKLGIKTGGSPDIFAASTVEKDPTVKDADDFFYPDDTKDSDRDCYPDGMNPHERD